MKYELVRKRISYIVVYQYHTALNIKKRKKCGVDLISYDMLKCFMEYNTDLLLKLFSYVLHNNAAADD